MHKVEDLDATTKVGEVDQMDVDYTSKLIVKGAATDGTCYALPIVKSVSDVDIASSEDKGISSFKHPKGFKELQFRIDNFAGNTKEIARF